MNGSQHRMVERRRTHRRIGGNSTARWLRLALAFLLLLAACTGADEVENDGDASGDSAVTTTAHQDSGDLQPGETPDVTGTPSSWTFMVYLIGDNNLEPFALDDLAEMASVGSQAEFNIVVLADRSAGYTDAGTVDQGDWETAKLFHVLPDSLEEIADLGEVDMGDPTTLAQFLVDATGLYPAEHYALSVWDHGGGWTGIGPDESTEDLLGLAQLADGLGRGLEAAGVPQLDLLGFDACLMATYEVASAVAPFAAYFMASQELEPGHGWDYGAVQVLADDPGTDGAGLGMALLAGFDAYARANGTGQDITLSLIDNAAMPALDAAMSTLAGRLTEQAAAIAPVVGRQRGQTLEFGRSENPADSTQLADLGMFVAELGVQSLQVSDEADAVIRALNDAVVARTAGPLTLGSTGLSIYFPPNDALYDAAYPAGQIAAAAGWSGFLSAYYGAGNSIPPQSRAAFAEPEAPLQVFDVEGGVEVEAAFDPNALGNLVDAFIVYGIVDPDSGEVILLGDDDALIAEDGSGVVTGFTDLTTFVISDGEDQFSAYLGLTTDPESGLSIASIPLDYLTPDAAEALSVELSIVIDPDTFEILEETLYVVDDVGTWGQFVPDPLGLLVPVLPIFTEDGGEDWVAASGGLYADLAGLEYSFEPIPPGNEVYVLLGIEDFGGNVAIVEGSFIS